MSETITVEVAYALPNKQTIKSLSVPIGTTALAAVELSGITKEYPQINLETDRMGIFSKAFSAKQGPDVYELKAGDRVEIYRPLIADPKEARRKRAEKKAAD